MRNMRRSKQLLSEAICIEVIARGSNAVLCVNGDEGYPYPVPVSYAYAGGKLYIHGAKQGYKIDAIERDERVSLCIVDKDENHPEELTSYFRSVIIRGRAKILHGEDAMTMACHLLAEKYSPMLEAAHVDKVINGALQRLSVIEITIEEMTGKEAIELVREREAK